MRKYAFVLGALALMSCKHDGKNTDMSALAGDRGLPAEVIVNCSNSKDSFTLSNTRNWDADGYLPTGQLTVNRKIVMNTLGGQHVLATFLCYFDGGPYRADMVHPKRIKWCKVANRATTNSGPGQRAEITWGETAKGVVAFSWDSSGEFSARVVVGEKDVSTALERAPTKKDVLSCRYTVPEECNSKKTPDCKDPSDDE